MEDTDQVLGGSHDMRERPIEKVRPNRPAAYKRRSYDTEPTPEEVAWRKSWGLNNRGLRA